MTEQVFCVRWGANPQDLKFVVLGAAQVVELVTELVAVGRAEIIISRIDLDLLEPLDRRPLQSKREVPIFASELTAHRSLWRCISD